VTLVSLFLNNKNPFSAVYSPEKLGFWKIKNVTPRGAGGGGKEAVPVSPNDT
jgi:hypothetical protein